MQAAEGPQKIVKYIGIASDEKIRVERWGPREGFALPLVSIGWNEAKCMDVARELEMLSPTYTTGTRDGCWFCHNQGLQQLRNLRNMYPDLWALLLKWDDDTPTSFRPDGKNVRDYDERFRLEDEGLIDEELPFRWDMLACPCRQMKIQDFLKEEKA